MTPTETLEETPTATGPEETTAHTHSHEHTHAPALNPELVRSVHVEATADEVNKAYQAVTKRYAKVARFPGFRAGKVPESVIKSRMAKEVRQEVMDALVSERLRGELARQQMQPVSQMQISELLLAEGAPLKLTATFEVRPEIKVDGYETLAVQRPDAALSEEEYEAELRQVLDHHATVEPVEEDRALADGDWAEIGFKGTVQDVAQTVGEDGLKNAAPGNEIAGEDALIEVGGKNTLQAFNDALRGAKVGQELQFEAAYPAEFGEARLAGKTVSYDVTVKAIKKKTLPEQDDEFAQQLGAYESWTDFTTKLRDNLARRKKEALEARARDIMLEDLAKRTEFPVPETFVQEQIDMRLERGLRALAQQGMSADAMRQLDFKRLREAQREQAVQEVKIALVLGRIAELENITVSDDEMDRELLMLSIQAREPVEALRKRLTEDGSLGRIREQMRHEKTGRELFDRLAR